MATTKNKHKNRFKNKESQSTVAVQYKSKQKYETQLPYISLLKKLAAISSVFLNLYLAWLTLKPRVSLEYSSYIIPEVQTALPLRVINNNILGIKNVYAEFTDNIITDQGSILYKNKGNVL